MKRPLGNCSLVDCSPVFPDPRVVLLLLPEALGEEQSGLRSQRDGTVLSGGGGGGHAELEDGDGLGAETSVPAEGERNDSTNSVRQIVNIGDRKFGCDAESYVLP